MATSFLTELLKRRVYTVRKDITLTEVIEKLSKLNVGSLPVVDRIWLELFLRETLLKTLISLGVTIF